MAKNPRIQSEDDPQARLVRGFVWTLIAVIFLAIASMNIFPEFWDPIFAWIAQTGAH